MKTIILGCERGDQIQKYGSYDACMKAREKKMSEQEIKKEDFEYLDDETKAPKGFGDPIKNKKWLMYGLIAVAGYFAYKKFKK